MVAGEGPVPTPDEAGPAPLARAKMAGPTLPVKAKVGAGSRASRAAGLSPIHQRLWTWLQVWAPGREKAVPRKRIVSNLQDPGSVSGREFYDITERRFKQLTKELLDAGYPMFSSEKGYYAAQDNGDLADFRRYLRKLAMPTIRNRTKARWALEAQRLRLAGEPVPEQRPLRGMT